MFKDMRYIDEIFKAEAQVSHPQGTFQKYFKSGCTWVKPGSV